MNALAIFALWTMAIIGAAAPLAAAGASSGSAPAPASPAREVAFEQHLGAALPLDIAFTDEESHAVRLSDYFAAKPVILVLGYYHCPNLCSTVATALADSLERVSLDAGPDFTVLAVSIDPRETPMLAAEKKAAYLRAYRRPDAESGWHFLTGGEGSIARVAASVGFRYRYDPALDQYAHAAGVVLLTPGARIARYFFGVDFPPSELRLALVEASSEHIGSLADRLLLLCYHYDAQSGRYTFAILSALRLAAAATALGLGAFLVRAFIGERRRVTRTRDRQGSAQ